MDRIDLERYIERKGLDADLISTGESVHTAESAAERMGVEISDVVKSIVFMADDRPVLVIACGDGTVDKEKLAEAMDAEECRLAEKDEIVEATGYSAGEVPPVGVDIPKVIDKQVMGKDTVYAGGGSDRYLLKVRPKDIKEDGNVYVKDVIR